MANVSDFISKLKGGGGLETISLKSLWFSCYAVVGGETESMAFLCTATNLLKVKLVN